MEKERFELHRDGRAIASVLGYVVGNFCVYKGYRWHIAHLHTHTKLLADFARRKDALAVVEALDSALWDFGIVPAEEQLENLHQIWTAAMGLCEKKCGIWYLREKDVTDTAE